MTILRVMLEYCTACMTTFDCFELKYIVTIRINFIFIRKP